MKKLFIFGSTGDLVKRKVIPALKNFENLEIIALGRKNLTKEEDYKQTNIKNPAKYSQITFNKKRIDCMDCTNFLEKNKINYFYVSLPPKNILPTLNLFGILKKQGYSLIALIEKPFGNSLKEAKFLARKIKKLNLEKEVFLSDHYLFKENFLKIPQTDSYKKIKIVSLETLGIEGRSYYDEVGAIKDMVQGHFLNMLFKIIPGDYLKKLKVQSVKTSQYPGYQKEIGKKSKTETYAKIILKNSNLNIEMETGKKAYKKESYIRLDNKFYSLVDKSNPYKRIFQDFFSNKKQNFPSIKDTLKAWKITEKILNKKTNSFLIFQSRILKFYKK
jgi:glucose-6-phosphate 1-dehydrogenase